MFGKNWLALLSYCITNLGTTILIKLQGNVPVTENGDTHPFYHPFMQTWVMIVGEALCILPFWWMKHEKSTSGKPQAKIWVCLAPLLLDLFSSSLIFAGLSYISGSVFSLMASLVVVFTALFSRCMLGSKPTRPQLIGCILTVIAAALAGVGQSLQDKSQTDTDLVLLGIVLITLAFAVQGLQMTLFQQIYAKYELNPLQMVGWQGMIGTVLWSGLMVLLANVGCPFPAAQCVSDSSGHLHLQDFQMFVDSLRQDWYLLALIIAFLLLVARYNFDQSTVILKTSAVTLCVLRIFSNGLVWVFGIVTTIIAGDDPQFQLQSLDLTVNAVKFVALLVSTLGLLIYSEAVALPFASKIKGDEELQKSVYSQLSAE